VLARFSPLEVVVEASPSWPWLYDLLDGPRCRFVLAHPKRLRAIAEADYNHDAIDATGNILPGGCEVQAEQPSDQVQTLVRERPCART